MKNFQPMMYMNLQYLSNNVSKSNLGYGTMVNILFLFGVPIE